MNGGLRLDQVSAGYGHAAVLENLTLTLPAGSLTALLGPSGCGKTTALRVVAGLVPVTHGEVWLGDERLTYVRTEDRGIGVVFQKPLLFPHMTVAKNVAFGLAMRGVAPAVQRQRVGDALHMVRLDGFADRSPRTLSGGQEQRVAIARALVTRPRVLLLDEPLSALDEHLRAEMQLLIRDLQRQLGITTLFVTHDQQEATEMADGVALLLDGRLAQSGPARDFYTSPVSLDVARFFGWCVLRGTAVAGQFHASGATFGPARDAVSPGHEWVAFHPSAARVCPEGTEASGTLPVTVERVLDLGPIGRVGLRLQSGERIDIHAAPQHLPSGLRVGQPVYLSISAGDLRFF